MDLSESYVINIHKTFLFIFMEKEVKIWIIHKEMCVFESFIKVQ